MKPSTASHNNTNYYTDTDRILEYSPSRGGLYYEGPALQKIILGFLGSALAYIKANSARAHVRNMLGISHGIPTSEGPGKVNKVKLVREKINQSL